MDYIQDYVIILYVILLLALARSAPASVYPLFESDTLFLECFVFCKYWF